MTDDADLNRYFSGRIYRWLSAFFGLFLVGVGIYAVFFGVVDPLVRTGVGLLIALLGADAIRSAIQCRQSWLARLSPFL